jgi:ATP-dependent Lhr-like helicase
VARLRAIAREKREEDVFLVHHGSVARALREEAEKELREGDRPAVIAATATLELGIDIGNLDRVIQIGSPRSVGAFLQRVGRSGRRTGVSEMYFTSLQRSTAPAGAAEIIPWPLLKTIAVIQLYLEERWIESPPERPLPYSLLIHQTLSVLASLGEHRSADLARRLLSLPPFRAVEKADYREILRELIRRDYIEKTAEGTLILGLEGEYEVSRYTFYPVFPEEVEYRVSDGGAALGTVGFLPAIGGALALAGRYWEVEGFDREKREIYVRPAEEGGGGIWRGGGAELDTRVALKMREVLAAARSYPYLSPRAREALERGRAEAARAGLTASPVAAAGIGRYYLLPWVGSRPMRALLALLSLPKVRSRLGVRSVRRENALLLELSASLSAPSLLSGLRELLAPGCPLPSSLVRLEDVPCEGKYDHLLPPALLLKQYEANMLDAEELRAAFAPF